MRLDERSENLRHGAWCDERPEEACDACRDPFNHPAGETSRWARPVVAGIALTGAFGLGLLFGHQSVPDAPARIGDHDVPVGVRCQEDEAIALVGPGDPVCVNVAELRGTPSAGQITVDGVTYDVRDQSRPACYMEPSETPEGVEEIRYADLADKATDQGIEVIC